MEGTILRPTDVPANVSIMVLTPRRLEGMRAVTSLDIFEGSTRNFHPDGLFSSEIFGRIGTDDRDMRFSFIDLKLEVLHPLIFKNLVKLKGLYGSVMAGKGYAVWDDAKKDFIASDEIHGQTGFWFFLSHWKDIEFSRSGSDIRDLRIEFIKKFKDQAMTNKVLVIPAGLRDLQEDENTGSRKESEVNDFYRRILSMSNTIRSGSDSSIMDVSRYVLQVAFNQLFDYLKDMLDGKRGFALSKWAKRNVYNSTRNVITSMDNSQECLGDNKGPKSNNTVVGMYQFAVSILPVMKYQLLTGWISTRFSSAENYAFLTNRKTLKEERVLVRPEEIDRWTRPDGLDKVIHSLEDAEVRMRPIVIQSDYYLGLLFLSKIEDKLVFKIFSDISQIPSEWPKGIYQIVPLTLLDLTYLCGYNRWGTIPHFITRYPITGDGSIYPAYPYVMTTIPGESRWELDDDWKVIGEENVAYEFPLHSDHPVFVEALSPNSARVNGLGGDYDGDMCSMTSVYALESINEVNDYLSSRRAYVTSDGMLRASPFTETVDFVLHNLTGEPK